MNSWRWVTGLGICNCERWFPQTCSCVSSQDGLSLQLETGGYVAFWSKLISHFVVKKRIEFVCVQHQELSLVRLLGRNGCRGAECALSRYQGVDLWICGYQGGDLWMILERLQLVQTWAGFWCFDCFSTSVCKVRGRDCGDKPADWLTKFMGEPLRLDALRLWGSDRTLYLRLFKHDLTDGTRRLARPKYKKLYPVLVIKSNFYHKICWRKWKFLLLDRRLCANVCWCHSVPGEHIKHVLFMTLENVHNCPKCHCPSCPKCTCLLESLFSRWPQDQVSGT